MQENRDRPRVFASALALVALGLPGILSLFPALPDISGVPRLTLLIDPLMLLVLAASLGAWLGPRCGFRSLIAEWISGGSGNLWPADVGKMIAAGIALGITVTLADHTFGPLWQERPGFPPSLVEAWSLPALLIGLLYGGVVEEIVMRWGLMSLLVWILWRLLSRRAARPPNAAVFAGLAAAALVFAASHLPALVTGGAEMTASLVVRTLGFNLMLGLVFGWLFARRDLESGMLAHAAFHIGVMLAALPAGLAL